MEKYINDDLVIKNEIYNFFKDSITCPLCLKIFINPLMCMKCQNVYCKKCIDEWEKKNNTCPNRCENPNYQKSIGKQELLSKLKFKCINCDEEIEYDNIEKHYNSCKSKTNTKKIKKLSQDELKKLDKEKEDMVYITSKKFYI